MWDRIKHAFSLESDTAEPNELELRLIDRLAQEVVRRGMTVPAMMFLEMSRPLGYLSSQAMHFFSPIATALFDAEGYRTLAAFLERRDALDVICQRLELISQGTETPTNVSPESNPQE